jgi:hypothetical protein
MTGESSEISSSNLEVVLLRRTIVLPWSQFLFAEGDNEEIRLAFSTHDVVVTGSRLSVLIEDLAARRLSRLQESGRADRFSSTVGFQIASISAQKVD